MKNTPAARVRRGQNALKNDEIFHTGRAQKWKIVALCARFSGHVAVAGGVNR